MKEEKTNWLVVIVFVLVFSAIFSYVFHKAMQPRKITTKDTKSIEHNTESWESEGIPAIIDMKIITIIESSNNPNAVSPVGARGLCQIMQGTWKECNEKLGYNWGWDEAFDKEKNLIIGTYYINKRIPQMLKYYKIEDNYKNRLMAYNWGIGNVKFYYENKKDIPIETQNYIKKYNKIYYN